MTADVELLPLPSVLLNWPHPTNHAAIRDYARACVAHATTAKDAEIEALRAEVETWKNFARGNKGLLQESVYRAERLAEALRHLRNHTSVNSHQIELIDAALTPTAAQDGK